MGVGVKIPDGQPLHMLEHVVAQVPEGALGHVDHQAALGKGGRHTAQVEEGHSGDGPGQAGEVRRQPGLDVLHQGDDITVDEGLHEQGPLHRGQDADKDADDHQDQVESVLPTHVAQHPPQGLAGVLQLGPGTPSPGTVGAPLCSRLCCHQSSPPSSKSPPPLVWDW